MSCVDAGIALQPQGCIYRRLSDISAHSSQVSLCSEGPEMICISTHFVQLEGRRDALSGWLGNVANRSECSSVSYRMPGKQQPYLMEALLSKQQQ